MAERLKQNPEEAKALVISYLCEGEPPGGGEGRYVYQDEVRRLLVQAGFADLALDCGWFGGYWAQEPKGLTQEEKEELYLIINNTQGKDNRYGLKEGWRLAKVAIPEILADYSPDLLDARRERVMADIFGLEALKKQLWPADKKWFSLGDSWSFNKENQQVRFWLNPVDKDRYQPGSYSLAELQQWLSDTGPMCSSRLPIY